jgi:hypothetical protein
MRKTGFAAIAALSVFCAGCSLFRSAEQTLLIDPLTYSTRKDSQRTKHQYRQWADAAWQAEMAANPEPCQSIEYKRGFEDGFADYLYAGGTGEPPPVPPRRLWNLDYRTPAGQHAVENWFCGFRRGAGAARDAGYRTMVTVPSSVLLHQDSVAVAPPPGAISEAKETNEAKAPKAPSPFEEVPSPIPVEFKGRPEPHTPEPPQPLPQIETLSPTKGITALPQSENASLEAAEAPLPEDRTPALHDPMPSRENGEKVAETVVLSSYSDTQEPQPPDCISEIK